MTVLVVGSNSFSGSHFCKYLLDRGYEVFGISRGKHQPSQPFNVASWSEYFTLNYNYLSVDICCSSEIAQLAQILKKREIVKVVNFAAQGMVAESWISPLDWYTTNVLGQVSLIDTLRKNSNLEKYIHVSTPEVYGNTSGWLLENMNFAPSTPYAISRAAFDFHLNAYLKAYGFPCIWTRAANVYGEGQQLYRVVPRAFLSALTGKPMDLHGGGLSERSFIHIEDVCSATLEILKNGNIGQTYHISTKHLIKIRTLVEKVFELSNANFDNIVKISPDRLGKDEAYKLDSSKIRSELKWEDKISLTEGLSNVYSWILKNINMFREMDWEYNHKR